MAQSLKFYACPFLIRKKTVTRKGRLLNRPFFYFTTIRYYKGKLLSGRFLYTGKSLIFVL